jgi:hypothetical protein
VKNKVPIPPNHPEDIILTLLLLLSKREALKLKLNNDNVRFDEKLKVYFCEHATIIKKTKKKKFISKSL